MSWLDNLDLSFNLCEAFPYSRKSLHYAFPPLNHLMGGFENYIRYVKPATLQVLHNCQASIGICVGAFYGGGLDLNQEMVYLILLCTRVHGRHH